MKEKSEIDKFVCSHFDSKRGTCVYNKKNAMEFLNSVGAVVKGSLDKRDSVDPWKEWSAEDWERYNETMSTLASGADGLNLPTGKIWCGGDNDGINPFCDQWNCEGRTIYEKKQKDNPDSFLIIRK